MIDEIMSGVRVDIHGEILIEPLVGVGSCCSSPQIALDLLGCHFFKMDDGIANPTMCTAGRLGATHTDHPWLLGAFATVKREKNIFRLSMGPGRCTTTTMLLDKNQPPLCEETTTINQQHHPI